jgi:hypothetical protein
VEEKNPRLAGIDGVLFDKIENRLLCYPAGKQDTHYTIPASITAVADSAFELCKNFTSITLPAGLTTIGDRAFLGCKSLTLIDIPSSVATIGDYAFSDCESLQAVHLSRKIPIFKDAFKNTPAKLFYTD